MGSCEPMEVTIARLESWCEKYRMQLAACGVAAMQNTEETTKERIGPDNEYYSASYKDVCDAVDREMKLRTEIEELKAENERLRKLTDIEDAEVVNVKCTRYEPVYDVLGDNVMEPSGWLGSEGKDLDLRTWNRDGVLCVFPQRKENGDSPHGDPPIDHWLENYESIGKKAGYTDQEIMAYRTWFDLCKKLQDGKDKEK